MKTVLYIPRDGMEEVYLPHAQLSIAAYLRSAGHSVDIVDGRLDQVLPDAYDVLGIGVLTGKPILDAIETASTAPGDAVKVWGGWHPTMCPEQTLEHPLVDCVVVGQGEHAMKNILEKGITSGIVQEEQVPISSLPRPDYGSHVDLRNYIYHGVIDYIASYGCSYRCSFCEISSKKYRWSGLRPESVHDDVLAFKAAGARFVRFEGSTFFLNREWARKVIDVMSETDLSWSIKSRVDLICFLPQEDLERLKESGCEKVSMGVESVSPHVLKILNKNITPEQIKLSIRRLRMLKFDVGLSFMFNVPGETAQDVMASLWFIRKVIITHPLTEIGMHLYAPYPGTELYRSAVELGFEPPNSLEGWARVDWRNCAFPWTEPSHIKKIERIRKFKSCVDRLMALR